MTSPEIIDAPNTTVHRIVAAYAAPSASTPLVRTTIERRQPDSHDVVIDVAYVGICHSDIHTVRGDWGPRSYPLVPGHEISGTVAAVGSDVTRFAVGDRVGVGCMVGSCGSCVNCVAGEEQYCLKGSIETYGSVDRDGTITQGGYSQQIVVVDNFVVHIPDELALSEASPLLCAGITTYSPLRRWGAGPGQRVAIIGLGGLGHVAVKIAHALGAEVTVLSQTLAKEADGRRLGADHYFATGDPETFNSLKGTFDIILNTVSAVLDLDAYLTLLATDGTLICVGAPAQPMSLSASILFDYRRSLAGSAIGGMRETQEMLDFCAAERIAAEVEVISASDVNEAYQRVLDSDVRYRFVIDAATI